jgi:hypothetical protein
MNTTSKGLLLLGMLSGSMAAQAQFVSSGTSSEATARNCVAGISGCDAISPIVQFAMDGTPGQTVSSASLVLPGYGQVMAGAALSGVIGAPILTATASSTAGTREGASAFALQSYTYTGTSSTTDTFGGTVTYSQTINGSYPTTTTGGGTAIGIEAFTLAPGALFNAGVTALDNNAALADAFNSNTPVDSGIIQTGFTLLGSNGSADTATNPAGTLSTGVGVNLNPGETVWILAFLQSTAPNGSTVDPVFNTQWSNSANLVTGVGVVSAPEIDPVSAASGFTLLVGSLLVLRGRRGRESRVRPA